MYLITIKKDMEDSQTKERAAPTEQATPSKSNAAGSLTTSKKLIITI